MVPIPPVSPSNEENLKHHQQHLLTEEKVVLEPWSPQYHPLAYDLHTEIFRLCLCPASQAVFVLVYKTTNKYDCLFFLVKKINFYLFF